MQNKIFTALGSSSWSPLFKYLFINPFHDTGFFLFPTSTPRVFHVETTRKPSFPRRFNMEYTWCVCMVPPENIRKNSDFLMFSGGIGRNQLHKKG